MAVQAAGSWVKAILNGEHAHVPALSSAFKQAGLCYFFQTFAILKQNKESAMV